MAGAADERLGEVPVAAVVADTVLPPLEELRRALRAELAAYEIPRKIVKVAAVPRTANGKVDRPGVLRAVAAAGAALG